MVKVTELPPASPKCSLMCAPKPCELFIRSVITPEPDHDACDGDLFTCECECHGKQRVIDLRDVIPLVGTVISEEKVGEL